MPISKDRKYFFLGPNSGFVSGGLPDNRCFDFYAKRSGHGLHCAIVGNVVIPGGVGTNKSTPEVSNSSVWSQLASAIRSAGAVPGIQLATVWKGYSGQKQFVSPSRIGRMARYKAVADMYSVKDVEQLFTALRIGTELAIDAGFRHIQLHAAHGYLFSILVDQRIYSGAANVVQKIAEWASWVAELGAEPSVRCSLRTGDQAFDEHGKNEFLDLMASLPISYLDVSSGFYDIDKRLIYPSLEDILIERRCETMRLAKCHPDMQFIYSGKSARASEADLPVNVHIGICRDLIANPNFLEDRDNGCKNMMKCHWYSRGKERLICGRWGNLEV